MYYSISWCLRTISPWAATTWVHNAVDKASGETLKSFAANFSVWRLAICEFPKLFSTNCKFPKCKTAAKICQI